ncbi:hypothetical protein LTR36_007909 [Oleoguttula mirabilis]|uniref:IEC3 subunit of the Ino80 complex, chromatin re-modelling-domain-containing protein n=1 Tax=Oleoguttula mirabilis TaxID=1507867 RepID=A0AAV9J9L0_9PEZI|nr:hypothetical protein LTR36_007909 [Oleoguttula mirabilis]
MSDSESLHAHPTIGGKSLESLQPHSGRAAYKSWRKKYRKMRVTFDGVLEANKRLFRDEHKLESIAKRLREELDGLLDICLDLNENPSIPPDLRFNIRPAPRHAPNVYIEPQITPEVANSMVAEYREAVSVGRIPPLDLHVVRDQIEQRLAAQGTETLDDLSLGTPHPVTTVGQLLPEDIRGDDPPSYLSLDQETTYLLRLDTKLGGVDPFTGPRANSAETAKLLEEEKHFATLTPREQERQIELLNPQSQHSWLKTHAKTHPTGGADVDDNESLASHEAKPAAAPRKRGGGGAASKNLAKQVGDRAVERAREGFSPSAGSASNGFPGDAMEPDELGMMEDQAAPSSAGRKRVRDPDGAYRVKGGKGGAGAAKGKRKRGGSGEDGGGGSSKKARVTGDDGS